MLEESSVLSSQMQNHSPERLPDLLAGTQQEVVDGCEVTDVD